MLNLKALKCGNWVRKPRTSAPPTFSPSPVRTRRRGCRSVSKTGKSHYLTGLHSTGGARLAADVKEQCRQAGIRNDSGRRLRPLNTDGPTASKSGTGCDHVYQTVWKKEKLVRVIPQRETGLVSYSFIICG